MKGKIFNKFLLNSAVTQIDLHARFGRLYMRSAQGKSLAKRFRIAKVIKLLLEFPHGEKSDGEIFPMGTFSLFYFPLTQFWR
jgi:hypothetical protein